MPDKKRLIAACAAVLLAGPAYAGAADNTMTIGIGEELPGFDGYTSTSRDAVVMTRHIYDMLVFRNPETFGYEPLLATSWEQIDDLTLEFKLRPGVTFHDGSAFDAEDVAFTLNHYADPEAGARSQASVSWIDRAEVVDPMTVRVISKAPFPAALEYLSGSLPIYPSDYVENVDWQEFSQKPVGTGPYMVVPGNENSFTLKAHDGYFEGGGKGTPSIAQIDVRIIPDTATRIAEMIGGGVDWIWNVPADQVPQLDGLPKVTAELGSTMRIALIAMDAAGRNNEGSPLKDVRVRQAINHAIDKPSLVAALVGGDGKGVDVPCFPMQFGCDTQAAVSYAYDVDKAKALLAEAGYADGFTLKMSSFRDRARAEAVQSYLGAIGITVELQMEQPRASFSGWREGKLDLWYGDWGSFSIADASASTGNFFNGSSNDGAMDEDVIALIKAGASTVDREKRKELYAEAIAKITDQAYWVPMHTIVMGYAYSKDLNFDAAVDEVPRFFSASWSK